MDTKTAAINLRKLATEIRKRAEEVERTKIAASAQVLVAADGLSRFQNILRGGDDE